MRWATPRNAKGDRATCPWLIRRFVDPNGEFIFAQSDQVLAAAEEVNGIPYDVEGVELGQSTAGAASSRSWSSTTWTIRAAS